MTVNIEQITPSYLKVLISFAEHVRLKEDESKILNQCIRMSQVTWAGLDDDLLVCAWGLVPPTLLSDRAYLWLFTTSALEGREFIFVRHSQMAMEGILDRYPIIIGHAAGDDRSKRWLRWLGAKMIRGADGRQEFMIRRDKPMEADVG